MSQAAKGISHFASLDGIRVHYTEYGEGEMTLLLVHGWNCDESVWQNQTSALARKARVITIDLPGHGQSDQPEIPYTMELQARAAGAVLEAVGAKSAILIGHSNGTPVIRQFYRRHPEKVSGLVIVDGALRPFGDQAMMEKFIAPLRGPDYAATVARFAGGMTQPMKNAADVKQIEAMMRAGPQHVAASEMEGLLDPALWERDKINVPVLMILARQPAWTPEYEEFAHSLVPDLDYQTWDGVSHFVMMDEPEKFNEAVLTFLKKIEAK